MISRRRILAGTAATALLPVTSFAAGNSPTDYVNPFLGSGGHGHTYPGATMPFGMIQVSPDTYNLGWDSCSGYHIKDGSILGFSHTHLSGTGCPDLLDLLVVPRTGPVVLNPGTPEKPEGSYRSRYTNEAATPGYYRVDLTDSRVQAELTATTRVGLHRYHFPAGEAGHLLIDWQHSNMPWWKHPTPTGVVEASLQVIGNDTLVGGRRLDLWAKDRWVFFALKVSRPFREAQLYSDDTAVDGTSVTGTGLKCALHFDEAGQGPLLVKAAVSAVDIEGALHNLADLPDFDFERVRNAAHLAWENELNHVRIEAISETDSRIFHTAHYHALLAPTVFSDADGRYRGMDNQVHQLPAGETAYTTYSLWDTYRASHPFFNLTQSARVPDMLRSLVRMGEESPAGVPIWPLYGRETDTMVGYHYAAILAEARRKGVKGVNYHAAYAVARQRAFDDQTHDMPLYRRMGYLPADQVQESVSKTLENAYSDWCTSRLAEAVGAHEEAKALKARSLNYRNLFDRYTGFMRGRQANGEWVTPYNPHSLGHDQARWRDFTETNGWQATFLNQHDLYGYMALFGGDKAFEAKLDALFVEPADASEESLDDISGLIGQYAHGNEPSHHVAYLYAYTGSPWKTQKRVREIMATLYRNAPDGLEGNEDCGQMSAWYLMSALGFYAVDPVSTNYVFGSPLVKHAEVALGGGRRLVIDAPGNSAENIYVQAIEWNGRPWHKSWISHADLIGGGRLTFKMGPQPNISFGAALSARPSSFV
jgi:predicted alpha-1,2-mannosidase